VAVKNAKESADLKTKQTIEALSGLNYDKSVWTGKKYIKKRGLKFPRF